MVELLSLLFRYLFLCDSSFVGVLVAGVCWFLAPRHDSRQPQLLVGKRSKFIQGERRRTLFGNHALSVSLLPSGPVEERLGLLLPSIQALL
jgi:hypothetical protein